MKGSRIADEFLAEESGLDYDEIMSDQSLADLGPQDFMYECGACDEISHLSEYEDLDHDGDTFGQCPKCGTYCMIIEVRHDDEDEPLKE